MKRFNQRIFCWAIVFATSLCLSPKARGEPALQVLWEFFPTNGPVFPGGRFVQLEDGAFYGTSAYGGEHDFGTVFKFVPPNSLFVLDSFDGCNGSRPLGLVAGDDGALYGTTRSGGDFDEGTFFRTTTNGGLISLFSFQTVGPHGRIPSGALVNVGNGQFYGITARGGIYDLGTVFSIATNGALTTLVSFDGTNGASPFGALAQGIDGAFYGTAMSGGNHFNGGEGTGWGTVFRITTNGLFDVLAKFEGYNGREPASTLTLADDGYLYGTTRSGGINGNGTVFRLATNGSLISLAHFDGANGALPGSLIQGGDSSFYGVAAYRHEGLLITHGTIFKMNTNGLLTTLVRFDGHLAKNPAGEFIRGKDGNIYGLFLDVQAYLSLSGNAGMLFRLVEPPRARLVRSNEFTTLEWSSFTNGTYGVEYKSLLSNENWIPLATNLTATGETTAYDHVSIDSQGYYRIVLMP